ncbi:MAG: TonB-dependent receptor [Pseudomonadota bacterium]
MNMFTLFNKPTYPVSRRTIRRGIALCAYLPGLAQAVTEIPEVLVSASRSDQPGITIPAAHYVLDRQQIVQSAARTLSELLDQQPGIHTRDNGTSVAIDMRGFGSTSGSNVVILLNGRKLNPSTDMGQLPLNAIDLDQVQQVEVIFGSAGTLYGNQATGGLINVITQRPVAGQETQARIGLGNYQSRELMLQHTARYPSGMGVSLSARQRRSDNYRTHNDSDIRQLSAEVDWENHNSRTAISLRHLDEFMQLPGALFTHELAADRRQVAADYMNDFQDTRSTTLTFSTEYSLNPTQQLAAELTYQKDARDFLQSFRGWPGSPATQDRKAWSLNTQLTGQLAQMDYTLGLDWQQTDYLLVSGFGPQGNDQKIIAGYGQVQFAPTDIIIATLGLRHASVDNHINNNTSPVRLDDTVTVGSAGLEFAWSDQFSTFLRADQNYRFAKVDEHTNVVFGQPAGLENQRSVSYEAGLRFTTPVYQIRAQAYRLNLQDEISYDASKFANINLDRSRRLGALISADWAIDTQWDLGGSWEMIDSEITAGPHQGNRVPLVPQQRGTLYLQYQPTEAWHLRSELERVSDQVLGSDFNNTGSGLPAYTVLNLVTSRETDQWRFSARVDNLLNKKYVETGSASFAGEGFFPAPERSIWLTASYFFTP